MHALCIAVVRRLGVGARRLESGVLSKTACISVGQRLQLAVNNHDEEVDTVFISYAGRNDMLQPFLELFQLLVTSRVTDAVVHMERNATKLVR